MELPALRHLSYGGGKMPVPVIERALALMPHVDFVNAYGLTETSSTIAVPDARRPPRRARPATTRPCAGGSARSASRRRRSRSRSATRSASRSPDGEPGEIWVARRAGRRASTSAARRRHGDWFATRRRRLPRRGGLPVHRGPARRRHRARRREHLARRDRGRAARAPGRRRRRGRTRSRRRSGARTSRPSVVLIGDVDIEELREWVRGRLRSTRVPAMVDDPHRAAVQRDRQAAAAGAQGRSRAAAASGEPAVTGQRGDRPSRATSASCSPRSAATRRRCSAATRCCWSTPPSAAPPPGWSPGSVPVVVVGVVAGSADDVAAVDPTPYDVLLAEDDPMLPAIVEQATRCPVAAVSLAGAAARAATCGPWTTGWPPSRPSTRRCRPAPSSRRGGRRAARRRCRPTPSRRCSPTRDGDELRIVLNRPAPPQRSDDGAARRAVGGADARRRRRLDHRRAPVRQRAVVLQRRRPRRVRVVPGSGDRPRHPAARAARPGSPTSSPTSCTCTCTARAWAPASRSRRWPTT